MNTSKFYNLEQEIAYINNTVKDSREIVDKICEVHNEIYSDIKRNRWYFVSIEYKILGNITYHVNFTNFQIC